MFPSAALIPLQGRNIYVLHVCQLKLIHRQTHDVPQSSTCTT